MEPVVVILGGLATILSGIAGTYAVIMARRTEARSATREETQQALEAQSGLLDRYEKRIESLESKVQSLEKTADDALGRAMSAESAHRDCEQRLEVALLEMQGRMPPS